MGTFEVVQDQVTDLGVFTLTREGGGGISP